MHGHYDSTIDEGAKALSLALLENDTLHDLSLGVNTREFIINVDQSGKPRTLHTRQSIPQAIGRRLLCCRSPDADCSNRV